MSWPVLFGLVLAFWAGTRVRRGQRCKLDTFTLRRERYDRQLQELRREVKAVVAAMKGARKNWRMN